MKKVFMFVMVAMLGIFFMGISSAIAGGGECGPVGTGTPGYWKNHPGEWPLSENGILEICFQGIDVPCISQTDALLILEAPVKGDKWRTMFKAYAAAYLNVKKGNCRPYCEFTTPGDINLGSVAYWLVDNMSTTKKVRGNSEAWQYSHGEIQYWCLDDYNNGRLPGIPSRDALE